MQGTWSAEASMKSPSGIVNECFGPAAELALNISETLASSEHESSLTLLLSRKSFVNLSRWLADARALASPHLVIVLVGNKSDREDDREVEWAEASRWASQNGM